MIGKLHDDIKNAIRKIEFMQIIGIGSRKGCIYFFKCEEDIIVRCGCFFGTIDEFENEVKSVYSEEEQYYKEYIGAINYIKSIL